MPSNKELRLKVVGVISTTASLAVLLTSIVMLMKVVGNTRPLVSVSHTLERSNSEYNRLVEFRNCHLASLVVTHHWCLHPQCAHTIPASGFSKAEIMDSRRSLDAFEVGFEIQCGSTSKYKMLLALSITGIVVAAAQFITAHVTYFASAKHDSDNQRSEIQKFSSLWMFSNMILLIPHFLLCVLTFYYGQCRGRLLQERDMQNMIRQSGAMSANGTTTTTANSMSNMMEPFCQEKLCNLPEWFAFSNCLVINIGILFILIAYVFFNIVKHIDYKEMVRQEHALQMQRRVVPNTYSTSMH